MAIGNLPLLCKCGKDVVACGASGLGCAQVPLGEELEVKDCPVIEPSSCVMAIRSSGTQGAFEREWEFEREW